MTPLIVSTRRSDATLRAIRSVTMVGNVSTFLTSSIGDPPGTQPTVGLTPRTITDPASFMVGPAGLEPATSSTPRKRATTCATARRQQLYRERANRERGDEDCGTKRATEEVRVIPSPFVPLPPGRGKGGWRLRRLTTRERGNRGTRECESGETRKDVAERRLLKMGWGRSPRALRPASGSPGNLLWRISGVSWRADSERSGPELSPSPGGRL